MCSICDYYVPANHATPSPLLPLTAAKVVSFNVSASEQTVVEGNGFTLPLTLNYVCVAPFTIDVVVTGGTADGT